MATPITVAVNRPRECKEALSRADGVITIDIETTGTKKYDTLVSVGVLADPVAHILFYDSRHASVRNISIERIRDALSPLINRPDLIVVGHGFGFDLGHFDRVGIQIDCQIRDTEKILRLLDQDRGRDGDSVKTARIDRFTGGRLDYRLKNCVPQLLGLPMINFPGNMALLDRAKHIKYLTSDLKGTKALYDHLWPQLSERQRQYHEALVSPLTPITVKMTRTGFPASIAFIEEECGRLERLKAKLSRRHERRHGEPLTTDARWQREWLFTRLGLKPKVWEPSKGGGYYPPLNKAQLYAMIEAYDDPKVNDSLRCIHEYRRAESLRSRLQSLARHVERDGRIRTSLNDRQATGRISSSEPNLQQVAKEKRIAGLVFRPRNVLTASPGHVLVSFDVKQADIRALAEAVSSFKLSSTRHLERLRLERMARIGGTIAPYLKKLRDHRNPYFRPDPHPPAVPFYPFLKHRLAEDFHRAVGDFYVTLATSVLGRPPADDSERDRVKTVALGTINGQGVESLAKAMKCSEAVARRYLNAFEATYPTEMLFKRMTYDQIAMTGKVETLAGRVRANTAHAWMTSEAEIEILISYRRSDAYWMRVVPLEPNRHVLTCWVKTVWDARPGPLRGFKIYDNGRRLTDRPYRIFVPGDLQYTLPVKNVGWRSIRRVRTATEEARYEGFDATARSLFNHLAQGGTSDIVKSMMVRSEPICRQHVATMLLQIHDELVFDVPAGRIDEFIPTMKSVLQSPPWPGFSVPIAVDAKRGVRFGEMTKV